MKHIDAAYLALGATWLVIGMSLGIWMGAAQNFQFAPLHAHINLVGFACHSIFGIAYRLWPDLKATRLAAVQFWLFVVSAPLFVIGLYLALAMQFEILVILSSFGLALGALLFCILMWRTLMRPAWATR